MRSHLVVFLAALMSLALTGTAQAQVPRVAIEGGTVVGVQTGEVTSFKGIPFAAPPVRELRWRSPQPVAPWSGEF